MLVQLEGPNLEEIQRQDLLRLCDDLNEVSDCCAFLCDAFAALIRYDCPLDESAARGASYLAGRLKTDLSATTAGLQTFYERYFERKVVAL